MPSFVLTEWLSRMAGASRTKLQEFKKKYCMLDQATTREYMALVKLHEPLHEGTTKDRHLHHDKKIKATVRVVITMRARGHVCGCDKAAQLSRILTYLWQKDRDKPINKKSSK